jgi:hypothetical protein
MSASVKLPILFAAFYTLVIYPLINFFLAKTPSTPNFKTRDFTFRSQFIRCFLSNLEVRSYLFDIHYVAFHSLQPIGEIDSSGKIKEKREKTRKNKQAVKRGLVPEVLWYLKELDYRIKFCSIRQYRKQAPILFCILIPDYGIAGDGEDLVENFAQAVFAFFYVQCGRAAFPVNYSMINGKLVQHIPNYSWLACS